MVAFRNIFLSLVLKKFDFVALSCSVRTNISTALALVVERVEAAGMTVDNFSASVDGFLIAMEEQDKQFEEQVAAMRAQGVDEEREQQLDQLAYMRANAKAQMLCIRDICARITGAN